MHLEENISPHTKIVLNDDGEQGYSDETTALSVNGPLSEFKSSDSDFAEKFSKVRIEWINLQVDVVLPLPTLLDRVKSCCCKKNVKGGEKNKPLLKGVSGYAESGSLLAIMGASGAGKTTLLNVLSNQCLSHLKIKGSILVNNRNIGKKLKSVSAYVRQEDLFIGTLTVKEHLTFQALLRLGSRYSIDEKKKRVADILTQLSLIKCQDTLIGIPGRIRGISGGELKRLSFASELITNPNLLFVDEPTSGLDSFMAEGSVLALQNLAKQGKTILATIHQPSSEVFSLFDRLLLLSEGRIAFFGDIKDAVDFFNGVGYPCPSNYNPADHYIRTLAIYPGKKKECIERCEYICLKFEESTFHKESDILVENGDEMDDVYTVQRYKENCFVQFKTVFHRAVKSFLREPVYSKVKLLQSLFIAIIGGLVFFRQDNNQAGVRNINGAIFFLLINLSFSTVWGACTVFPREIPIFLKENSQQMYRVDVYFMARTLSEAPFALLTTSVYCTIVYWMAGLYPKAENFLIYFAIMNLIVQVAASLGYVISAVAPTVIVALALIGPILLPLVLFGGFFVQDESVPVYFIWLKALSWLKYGFESLQINQWESYGSIGCKNGTEACLTNGLAVLQSNGFHPENFSMCIGVMVALLISLRIIAFLLLVMRAYRSK